MGERLRLRVVVTLAVIGIAASVAALAVACTDDGGAEICADAMCDGSVADSGIHDGAADGNAPQDGGGPVLPCRGAIPGTLDETFGGDAGGLIWLWDAGDEADAVVVQPDGKILLGGTRQGVSSIVRLLPDGSFDTTFGSGGIVLGGAGAVVMSLALQADGKIVAAGATGSGNQTTAVALARFLGDGTPDPSFGDAGATTTSFVALEDSHAATVIVQPDGRILVGGYVNAHGAPATSDFALARFQDDGSLDPAFADGGVVTIDVRGTADLPGTTALALSGEILIGGGSAQTSTSGTYGHYDLTVIAVTGTGEVDTAFGDAGVYGSALPTSYGTFSPLHQPIAIDGSGRILLGTGLLDLALVRLAPDGRADPTFGDGGTATSDGGDDVSAMVLAEDGRIIVAGSNGLGSPAPVEALQVARYAANGALDPSFGSSGSVVTVPPGDQGYYLPAAAALSDCSVVVAGTWTQISGATDSISGRPAMGVARYHR